ncbi:hypothetical protein [Intrasporangium sp. YIM S08009]|uniref:hypothetical protein n=1 Tax=Intrasporangium zincisolvens TaxID=3080018 RepID=UPI002B05FC34|nr:hypothetical protein [Intrasporangium sp. YIM S08009]
MPVSSLIFVVIVAIWAAYLVQHWMRRREDAAANRSVDGFSEAMRVLEKRPVLPTAEPRTPRPHSYSVTPARAARPTVDVKRAVPAGRRQSPLVARRSEERLEEFHVEHEVERDARPDVSREQAPRPGRRVPMAQRRIRAVVLVAAMLWIPASISLAVTGVLMWISVPFAVLTVVAVLVWLRTEAQHDRIRAAAARRVRRVRGSRSRVAPEPVLTADDTQVIHSTAGATASAATAPARGTRAPLGVDRVVIPAPAASDAAPVGDRVFDVQAAATGAVPVASSTVTADTAVNASAGASSDAGAGAPATTDAAQELPPGSWSPVPVPKPTYALKAKAEPRYTEGGIPADVFDTPEFADEAEELDDRALFARRAASQ